MVATLPLQEHRQSLGEEIANSVSHCVGLLAAVAAAPVLVVAAVRHGGAGAVAGASVLAGTACHCVAVWRYAP